MPIIGLRASRAKNAAGWSTSSVGRRVAERGAVHLAVDEPGGDGHPAQDALDDLAGDRCARTPYGGGSGSRSEVARDPGLDGGGHACHSFRGPVGPSWDDGQAAQPEPDAVPADQCRDAVGGQRGAGHRAQHAAAGGRLQVAVHRGGEHRLPSSWVRVIADRHQRVGQPGADVVAALDGEERRDVELLVHPARWRPSARRPAGSSAARRRCCAPRPARPRAGRRASKQKYVVSGSNT